ncbi:FtsX-like permease family protein [Primorskyibacter aestuariivivens]|uniref:ABC transporter permease n=1 Tax=Primorskyibacter aestuariivivens TaxID=1888912 RepID=UPI0022FFD2E1|nr:FtsX-like permease family protein [Primorskyibacter aestuariivivens]MDA7429481.1 FtsX-like permease family protein [Primorskyibacter aestuariivivens]
MIWKIALRNIIKNARRSITTALAIGIGGLAALLFGGFVTSIWYGVQTSMIQEQGNLQIYRNGYLEFGAANPDAYTIQNWDQVAALLAADAMLAENLSVITPRIDLAGVAGNAETGNSKTFIGTGIVPSEVDQMRGWDGWSIGQTGTVTGLAAGGSDSVIVGLGMARMMGMCEALAVPNCQDAPIVEEDLTGEEQDFSALVEEEGGLGDQGAGASKPQLNVMAATSAGVPNIARVGIEAAQAQSVRAIDNSFVMMHFEQARSLLYGDSQEATALMLQVVDPAMVDAVKTRVVEVLNGAGLDLSVYHLTEVDPTFDRIFGMFSFIFVVVAIVLSIVIVFTIVNTISMTIVERVKEIGTIRALGFRKGFVRALFLTESTLIGVIGAAVALGGAIIVSNMVNAAGLQWTPPSNATPLTVQLMVLDNPIFAAAVVGTLIAIAFAAAVLPTFKAARLNIVESLQRA